MKKLLLTNLFLAAFIAYSFGQYQEKPWVDKKTGEFTAATNKHSYFRVFGYEKADTNSRKLICISVFTDDVDKNKYKCPLGAYYGNIGFTKGEAIFYISTMGEFAKFKFVDATKKETIIYMLKKLIDFE
jgi:hypothetical protein